MGSFLGTVNPVLTYSVQFHILHHKWRLVLLAMLLFHHEALWWPFVSIHAKLPYELCLAAPPDIWHRLGFVSYFTHLLCVTWKWVWIVCHASGLQGYGTPPQYGGAYGQQPYAAGQQYPGQPATVTVQPAVYVTQGPLANPVNDYLGYSIFTMLCCCLPLGIAALIYSISVSLIHRRLYSSWAGAQPWKTQSKMSPLTHMQVISFWICASIESILQLNGAYFKIHSWAIPFK